METRATIVPAGAKGAKGTGIITTGETATTVIVSFSMIRGLYDISSPINYGTRNGTMMYQRGIYTLVPTFNGEADRMIIFTERLADRAVEMGWNNPSTNIITITVRRNSVTTHHDQRG